MVLKYARWALERDEKIAVKIFTNRRSQEQPSERMRPDSVLHFLSPFATATVYYLEYLVCDKGLKVSQLWESVSYRIFPRGMKILCVKGAWKFQPPLSLHFMAPSSFSQHENDADLSHSTSPPPPPFFSFCGRGA